MKIVNTNQFPVKGIYLQYIRNANNEQENQRSVTIMKYNCKVKEKQ